MKIALFGATGRVGQQLLNLLLTHGYEVKALVRNPDKVKQQEGLEILVGDVLDEKNVFETIRGVQTVISTLGTDKNNVLSRAIPNIISAMKKEDITRLITTGTAGILNARYEPNYFRFETNESKRKHTTAAQDHAKAYLLLQQSDLDWTIACPTYLPDGISEKFFRTEKNMLPVDGKKITTGDTALFLLQLLSTDEYTKTRVGLAY
ncbi:putative NADH-flavin reductase [Salibacterium salarium]|uniref:NAD(P)-dependent oxidoreductase n=1 Tax=Salibacterium salarium TaxID=284579 RepID=UPI002786B8D1|nr:SDR family oxidoreductase [Salibacterium salarium]MDQ0299891.1 putative NADH-flavin reductase [Salibacterium salarium]